VRQDLRVQPALDSTHRVHKRCAAAGVREILLDVMGQLGAQRCAAPPHLDPLCANVT
jgi:hypothetical protein